MRYLHTIWISIALILIVSSCAYQDGDRNIEYSPNMYHSIPLEPYSQVKDDWAQGAEPQTIFKNGLNAQNAPEGTLPRTEGWYEKEAYEPYHLENDTAGYRMAMAITSPLKPAGYEYNGTPVDCSAETFQRGKRLYEVYCQVCHGAGGQGNGNLATKGNKPFEGIVPDYTSDLGTGLKNLPAGKMFHSITYGKGQMGSYASQMTPQQRWEVICYIQHFQRK
jgi:mono/diheme cytochrome c family protein